MFERFTDPARAAVVHAQERARAMRAPRVGSEHLLLGVADTGGAGGAALRTAGLDTPRLAELAAGAAEDDLDPEALATLGIDLDAVRARTDALFGSGALERAGSRRPRGGHIPFEQETKKALELALREAIRLRQRHIDTGHLLLGILRADCTGRRVLQRAGADVDDLRAITVTAIAEAAA
ncbi:Clp domain protein [Beutenbergia cavernae DSM 12333]|uniref:Clp domain protein n=1 Tax=Beutenbergia cavernae (strain ATCC BAA-8 / DSM 12333 / CCUG 43141 / JCM 11478 / NBRC 16432 / NCIMB 13614 / HKI 0122) TaxID=471853 RepID=C5BZT5_BEUC1|nr:Clp protease N-terminal domain-containing protein [Beutenbergia cavernae]ACQ81265.1 Clp domain protein [Beutenbergia cavernae DSM 12333]